MSIVFIPDTFHSERLDKDYYAIFIALVKDGKVIKKSNKPVLWLTKDQYEDYTSKK